MFILGLLLFPLFYYIFGGTLYDVFQIASALPLTSSMRSELILWENVFLYLGFIFLFTALVWVITNSRKVDPFQ